MLVKQRVILVAAAIALAFLSTAAQARPSSHHRLYARHAGHSRHHAARFRLASRQLHLSNIHHRPVRDRAIDRQVANGPIAAKSNVVALAARYIGSNPTGQRSLWCADFANLVLRRAHLTGTGSRMAKSFLSFPRTTPHPGAIAVMGRRGGGHVGFVAGFDPHGNPLIISGNSRGHRVAASVYDRRRIIEYVAPV